MTEYRERFTQPRNVEITQPTYRTQTRTSETNSISLLLLIRVTYTRFHANRIGTHMQCNYSTHSTVHRPVQRCQLRGPYFNFSCCITPLCAHGNEMHGQGRSNLFPVFHFTCIFNKFLKNCLNSYMHLNNYYLVSFILFKN